MKRYRLFITCLVLSLVSLSTVAQENLSPRGCRRGTPRPVYLSRGDSQNGTPGGDFYHGERHQLTVLAAFNDRPFVGDETATLIQWDKILNTKGLMEEPFKGSVHDYFLDQSYGDFSVIFDLVYVQLAADAKKYASTAENDENSQYLVQDIVDVLKTYDIDWSKYDWNDNGYINQLLIIHAGYGMNDSQGDDQIWPHQWWMSEHLKDGQEGVYCEPIPVSAGGKDYLVDCYCAVAEQTKYDDYATFGTICHEYTHCFRFPDFYNGETSYLYGWDLMDTGCYNGGGFQPVGYSAHERWLMGWLTPVELKETTSITAMPALADEGRAYLIRNDGYENEYYMVENRQPTGWDAALPGSGITIFHIDYDPSVWASTIVATNSSKRKRCVLFHANDNKTAYADWAYPYEENNSLTNTSTPAATLFNANSDGTMLMSKPITNMTVTSGLASFDFTAETTGINELTTGTGTSQLLYRIGIIDIVRDANGNVRKVINR